MSSDDIREALVKVRRWVESENFEGYDPYDALAGRIEYRRLGKWAPIVAIQLLKRSPINFRPVLGIGKAHNAKALGLFLEAYSVLYSAEGDEKARQTAECLFDLLLEARSKGYSGACWGYPFDWASPTKYLPSRTPSAVVTGFVVRGLFEYYRATNNSMARDLLGSTSVFVLEDLPRLQTDEGCCFSYTPLVQDCCYNASLLAAETLARAYDVTRDPSLPPHVAEAADFVVSQQKPDGRWHYSRNLHTGTERVQIDFHQGFLVDSLLACIDHSGLEDPKYMDSVRKGAEFYRTKQFSQDGKAYWRIPSEWPTDIHHLAQGIISFVKLATLDPAYSAFASTISRWTIDNMMDDEGFFYYRRGRILKNRIPYMRWGQAWMMVALARLLSQRTRLTDQPEVMEYAR